MVTEDGTIQLMDVGVLSESNIILKPASQLKNHYLAPEQLQIIKSKNLKKQYNLYKAEVYSMGMTMMHAATK